MSDSQPLKLKLKPAAIAGILLNTFGELYTLIEGEENTDLVRAFIEAGPAMLKLLERIAELEEWKADVENSYRITMDEKCTADEKHCTCVPILKQRIAKLESWRPASEPPEPHNETYNGGTISRTVLGWNDKTKSLHTVRWITGGENLEGEGVDCWWDVYPTEITHWRDETGPKEPVE